MPGTAYRKEHIMIRILLFSILLSFSCTLLAQDAWTLKSCIEYGLKNNSNNAIYRHDKQTADAKAREALAAYLPTVTLTGSLDDNIKVQETVIPAGIFSPTDLRVAFTKRYQLNPHFLFNMLNNVKALIRTDPEKASFVIVKLSEFLRFQLYENNEDKTLLTSEINFLSNFIGLEKIRRDNLSVSLQSNTDQRVLSSVFVPPNLFTTFVENAIKHSVDLTDTETYIHINIMVENQKLYFTCSNSVSHEYRVADKKNSGLGLVNIKRRLELLYGDSYSLDINAAEHKYTVTLIIPI
jgi:hypothetical protein